MAKNTEKNTAKHTGKPKKRRDASTKRVTPQLAAREFARTSPGFTGRQLLHLEVSVSWARSHDTHFYAATVSTDPSIPSASGWLPVEDPYTFAILAAAQAANRTAFVVVDGHDQSWGGGAGLFGKISKAALSSAGIE
jgi:hypothetical protein